MSGTHISTEPTGGHNTHHLNERTCAKAGNTKCVWSFLQHPNIYNPNKSKKAAVLDPAWHRLQSTHVCSVVKLLDLLELTPPKDVLFIRGDWNAKVGSQETPGVTGKFGLGVLNEAGQRLTEFCQENSLDIANTLFQQHKRRLYTWTSPDGQH